MDGDLHARQTGRPWKRHFSKPGAGCSSCCTPPEPSSSSGRAPTIFSLLLATRAYAAVVAVAFGITFVIGSLIYPTYRYHVRALYLDRHAVWAANLFDIKESFASIGLPLAIGAFLLSRVMDPREDRPMLSGYAVFVFGTTAIVWFNVISGLLITMEKGV